MEFKDLKKQYQILKSDIDCEVERVMTNCNFIAGEEITELEQQLANYVGVKHCIACANGTDALQLALMTWGVGVGDAVFVPDFTFFSSGEAPALLGATPIFVDVEKDTFNISPVSLEQAIKQVIEQGELNPKVIVAVDLFGQTADYRAIRELANQYDLKILEDGAQGFGGASGNKKACSFGDISTTSFFPAKPLGCYGDGGAIFTDNDDWAEELRSLCFHGKGINQYDNIRIGMNSRLDTMQAVILKIKLKQFINYELSAINDVARMYTNALSDIVITPYVEENNFSSWAQYTIICKDKEQRDLIKEKLKKQDIPTMIYYPKGMHEQLAFEDRCIKVGDYENTMYLKDRVLALPIHPYMTKEDVDRVVQEIKKNV